MEIMGRFTEPPRLMIVSDLDETMVDHHDPENTSMLKFNGLWEASYRHDCLLVFSTGRPPSSYRKLRKKRPILTPDVTVTSIGTEIAYGPSLVPDKEWIESFDSKWDITIVEEEASKFPQLAQREEARPHRVSYHLEKEYHPMVAEELSERLRERGLDVKTIYSNGIIFDIVPRGGGKGRALVYLLEKLKAIGKLPRGILVCGDSGNDAELFSVPGVYGVMVGNAQEELLLWHAENSRDNPKIIHATERCASGIIQALGHFNLGLNVPPRDIAFSEQEARKVQAYPEVTSINSYPCSIGHEVVNFYIFLEKWRLGQTEDLETFQAYLEATLKPFGILVHPSGAEKPLHNVIDEILKFHGDKRGRSFSIWVDQVLATEVVAGTWLVKFNRWEQCDGELKCCKTILKLASKEDDAAKDFSWVHVRQNWSEECPAKDDADWII